MAPRVVLIDNYDSFTYNLVQYLGELGADVIVHRNDAIDCAGIERAEPTHLMISPGPKTPDDAGITLESITHFAGRIPIFGVCLGHQAIGQAFGGTVHLIAGAFVPPLLDREDDVESVEIGQLERSHRMP